MRPAVIRTPNGLSLRFSPRALAVAVLCLVVALGVSVLLIGSGDFPMGPADVVRTLLGNGTPADSLIVNEIRLPRAAAMARSQPQRVASGHSRSSSDRPPTARMRSAASRTGSG